MALFGKGKDQGEGKGEELAARGERSLSRAKRALTIGDLEKALLGDFPREDAEEWDRTGLLVGERALPLRKVAVALDATVPAIREAAQAGANVLLTHHPAFLEPPASFAPEDSVALSPGAGVWAAIQEQVSLMDFHTALDVSAQASKVLPGMLGLKATSTLLEPLPKARGKGYGRVCDVPAVDGSPQSLGQLAARCTSVFGRPPRVWGAFDAPVRKAACATGSASGLVGAALAAKVDCLVCGELRYHAALDASLAGLSVIELGHDASELPLTAILAEACLRAGVAEEAIVIIDQGRNWSYPEAIRL